MLKKIILPLVLLIFTQQQIYGMKKESNDQEDPDKIWESINSWVNRDETKNAGKKYPKLWWLWAFIDNITFQYGGSKIWKHGEAYYGLSNGIGFFPSFLNFGWLKVGIGDVHINVINLILDYFKYFIQSKVEENFDIVKFLLCVIFVNLFFNIHIISVEILNCIKIKLVAPLTMLFLVSDDKNTGIIGAKKDENSTAWYITYNTKGQVSWWYGLFSPRVEINILELIDFILS